MKETAMFTSDWDYTPSDPPQVLTRCSYCGTMYEDDHPAIECLELQQLHEEEGE